LHTNFSPERYAAQATADRPLPLLIVLTEK